MFSSLESPKMSSHLIPAVGPADHARGGEDAPVTLVEYGDFECPHCGRAHPILQAIERQMGANLRLVFRHFPLSEMHPHAEHAAESAEMAGQKGQFWAMHDLLFEHQQALDDTHLLKYAAQVGLEPASAAQALGAGTFRPAVRESFMSGVRSGVNGTPTFFVNGERYDDSWDERTLLAALEAVARGRAKHR